jgi:hypothetical protein
MNRRSGLDRSIQKIHWKVRKSQVGSMVPLQNPDEVEQGSFKILNQCAACSYRGKSTNAREARVPVPNAVSRKQCPKIKRGLPTFTI